MLNISICASSKLCSNTYSLISSLPFGLGERQRLASMKNEDAKSLSLSAWLTLKELLEREGYGGSDDLSVLRTKERKPYFKSLPLHFSLSHTDGAVSAALCDSPVGIDLEWLDYGRNISAISDRFFNSNEQKAIALSSDTVLSFFSLWTKKEAYAKLTGKGLAAVCSGDLDETAYFFQYIIELGARRGILSVCCATSEDITIYDPYKEFKIYEL